jgi:tetratricopeptide (TPR) repeat protein
MMKSCLNKNVEFEIRFYEQILERTPDFVEALPAIGALYTRAGRYDEGLEVDKRLARLRPDDANVLYNLACSYSLLGLVEQSFEVLKRALTLGYDNLELLETDDDLKNLRTDERFQTYFQVLREKAAQSRPDLQEPWKIFKDQ